MRAAIPGLILLPLLLHASCQQAPLVPERPAVSLVAVQSSAGTAIYRGEARAPLATLDPWKVARLARSIFPDLRIVDGNTVVTVELDTPESADALWHAARWTDGMILARRKLEPETGIDPSTPAGIVAEAIRRWIRPEPEGQAPDWAALSAALETESIWESAPVTAGMGAVVFAGLVLRGEASALAKERAARILSVAVYETDVPGWLSWIAYHAWSRRDFLASDDSP